jgi:chromosome segregation ATPase
MNVRSLRIRRTMTLAGALAALILGFAAIQAAAAWTASAATLAASPASAKSIEMKLLEEQARSAALADQLTTITSQTDDMTAALTAAQERIVADGQHADKIAKDLAAATKKLKALEASIRNATVTRTTTVVSKSAGSSSSSQSHHDDDDHEGDHGD